MNKFSILNRLLENKSKLRDRYKFNKSLGKLETNIDLAREMLSSLPENLFISNDTKFLDPCAGTGTYIIAVLERLLKYKTYDIAINQVYMSEVIPSLINGYLSEMVFLPKTKINLDIENKSLIEYINLFLQVISNDNTTTFNDLSTIIHSESIKDEVNKIREEMIKFIEKYEKVSKLESKLFGEVFTPQNLIREMLKQLPPEIWKNKNLKWLDPAVGIGNFPAIIVENLMKGLEDEIPSSSERYKWIMEEMIYMCDISTKNLFLLYKLFDESNKLKLNVYRGSFLGDDFSKHVKNVWKIEGFDVIVGNPPYNDESTSTGDNKLYLQFIEKSFNRYLLKDKYLLFVTPKKSIENLTDLSKNRNYIGEHKKILFLSLDTPSRYFNKVGSSFCYFLIQNTIDDGSKFKIEFIDRNNKIDNIESNIYKWKKVPKYLDRLTISILEKTIFLSGERFSFKTMKRLNSTNFRVRKKQVENGSVSITENEEYKFKFIDKIKASGTTEYFIKEPMIESDFKKVIISQGGSYPFPFYDNGEFSCSDNIRYLLVNNEDEGILMVDFIKSKLIKFLEECLTKGIDMDFSYSILNILKIDFINMKSVNDIYQYYKLTKEEIDLIEKTIKN